MLTLRRACGLLAKVQTRRCAGSPLKRRAPARPERLEEPGQYGWWPVSTTVLQKLSAHKQLRSTKSNCRSVKSTQHIYLCCARARAHTHTHTQALEGEQYRQKLKKVSVLYPSNKTPSVPCCKHREKLLTTLASDV